MPRMKDDAQRMHAALDKLGREPNEAELLKLAKSVNVDPSRAKHVARARKRDAQPKRALRGEMIAENIKHPKQDKTTDGPISRQQATPVEPGLGRTDDRDGAGSDVPG